MLLHTIMRPEQIFLDDQEITSTIVHEIDYLGTRLEIREAGNKTYVVHRIISTNIQDFLNPDIQPGVIIELDYHPKNN